MKRKEKLPNSQAIQNKVLRRTQFTLLSISKINGLLKNKLCQATGDIEIL
jgi:hypothetical protein